MNSLITEFSVQEEISISYPFSNYPRSNFKPSPNRDNSFQTPNTQPDNPCNICKAAGRNYKGHSVKNYWFILKFDKLEMAKAFQVDVDEKFVDADMDPSSSVQHVEYTTIDVSKVQCDLSPYFYAFYCHRQTHIVLDTVATSSLISHSLAP